MHIPFPIDSAEVRAPRFNLLLEPTINLRPEIITLGNAAFGRGSFAFLGWCVEFSIFIFRDLVFISAKDGFVFPGKSSLQFFGQ
jgi:hypothetical protein